MHTMTDPVLFLTEEDIRPCLEWNTIFDAVKQMMADVSSKNQTEESATVQPGRGFMHIPNRNGILLTMPGFSERKKFLSCKLVTAFSDNPSKHSLPRILASILVFNPESGKLRAILEGTTITEWRTAVASAVATRTLMPDVGKNKELAVVGAGRQGRIHIIAFQHFFKFKKIRLWNRTYEKGVSVSEELKRSFNIDVEVFVNIKYCVKDADVVITATYSSEPLVMYEMLKQNVLINAVGAGPRRHCELDKNIYQKSSIYTDSMENAKVELKDLIDDGFPVLGEIGEIINGTKEITPNRFIIFHSLGMALEDGATAQLVLEKYLKEKKNLRKE